MRNGAPITAGTQQNSLGTFLMSGGLHAFALGATSGKLNGRNLEKKELERRNIAAPVPLACGFSRTAWLPPRRPLLGIEARKSVGKGRPPPEAVFFVSAYIAGHF